MAELTRLRGEALRTSSSGPTLRRGVIRTDGMALGARGLRSSRRPVQPMVTTTTTSTSTQPLSPHRTRVLRQLLDRTARELSQDGLDPTRKRNLEVIAANALARLYPDTRVSLISCFVCLCCRCIGEEGVFCVFTFISMLTIGSRRESCGWSGSICSFPLCLLSSRGRSGDGDHLSPAAFAWRGHGREVNLPWRRLTGWRVGHCHRHRSGE